MNVGVAFAQQYQLTPGVALTAAQMTLLTTDIVWLETQTVQLVGSSQSESKSKQTQSGTSAIGSTLQAGGNISLAATGDGKDSHLTVTGSDIAAGKNVTLQSDGDINLQAAQNTYEQHSTNKSSSAAVGVAVSLSSNGGAAFGFTASASAGRGHADGQDITQSNTHVTAGDTLTIKSGGDATLKGAVASGQQVIADVGGNLNIASLQDTSTYHSKDESLGGSVTVGMGFAGSINYSNSKVDGDYASVIEQSGIKAGDGGYQIKVAGNTDLKGGAIASSQAAIDQNNNSLTTGTLTISDIDNRANYSASSISVGGGLSMGSGGSKGNESGNSTSGPHLQSFGNSKSAGGGYGSDSGSASSVTQSGISGGTLVITDGKKQQELTGKTTEQTVASVNRDITSASASGGIAKNWDAQALKEEVQTQAQIMQTFGTTAAKQIGSYADGKQKEALANAKAAYDAGDKDAAAAYAADADKWGEGGIYRIALHTVAGALSGGAEGALGAAASASAADLLNGVQSDLQQKLTDMGVSKDTAALIAQGATGAVATGLGAAIGGTAGAATALNTDFNNRQLSSPEKELAKKLAAKSGGKYTTAQIEAQMRGMTMTTNGVTSPGGSAVVAGAVAPKDNGGTWIYAGTTADGKPIIVQQLAPEDAEIRAFIVRNTTGSEVPSLITYAGPYTVSQSNTSSTALPPAPAGTQRATVMVDGVAYSPLVAPCPAAGCMNGDPIAYGISDPGTQAYVDAVNRKAEKDLNIGTAVLGIGGAIIRGISTVGEVAAGSSAAVGNSASAVGSAASKSTVGALDSGANSAGGMGKVIGNYSAIEPGPLAENLAGTFAGGKYTTVTLENDTILYRAGTANQPLGQFFSLEKPIGVLQTRIDKAVLPEWPGGGTSPIDTSFAIKIPAGTQVYVGEVGTQSGFYIGGTQQIVVPKPWTINGVQLINSSPLK